MHATIANVKVKQIARMFSPRPSVSRPSLPSPNVIHICKTKTWLLVLKFFYGSKKVDLCITCRKSSSSRVCKWSQCKTELDSNGDTWASPQRQLEPPAYIPAFSLFLSQVREVWVNVCFCVFMGFWGTFLGFCVQNKTEIDHKTPKKLGMSSWIQLESPAPSCFPPCGCQELPHNINAAKFWDLILLIPPDTILVHSFYS